MKKKNIEYKFEKLEEIENKLIEIMNSRIKQVNEIEHQLNEAVKNKSKAESDMDAASKSSEHDKYEKAVKECWGEDHRIKMFEVNHRKLKGPMIEESEYEALKAEITRELDRINRENKKRAADYAQKMLDIKTETGDAINRGNALLRTLQLDIYKEKGKIRKDQGLDFTEHLKYKNYDLLQIIGQMESSIDWLKKGE